MGGDAGFLVCPRHGHSDVWREFARAEAQATGGFLASIQNLGCFRGSGRVRNARGTFLATAWGGDAGFSGVSPARLVCPRRGLLVCPRHVFSEVWWESDRAEAQATGFVHGVGICGVLWRGGELSDLGLCGFVFFCGSGWLWGFCNQLGLSRRPIFSIRTTSTAALGGRCESFGLFRIGSASDGRPA